MNPTTETYQRFELFSAATATLSRLLIRLSITVPKNKEDPTKEENMDMEPLNISDETSCFQRYCSLIALLRILKKDWNIITENAMKALK